MNFKLESDILGSAEEILQIPIFNESDFDEVKIENTVTVEDIVEPEKLTVNEDNIKISPVGKLSIAFNKPILLLGYDY